MWKKINTEEQIKSFMEKVEYFHDACIKELKYISGAFVSENLSMYPVNAQRTLNVLIQRQYEDIPMLELQFCGLKYMRMNPIDPEYTCEILGAAVFLKNNCIIWCDDNTISADDIDDYEGTVICSESLKWRSVNAEMGSNPYYLSKL